MLQLQANLAFEQFAGASDPDYFAQRAGGSLRRFLGIDRAVYHIAGAALVF